MSNEEKKKQLGMPIGTATAILRKEIMFNLVKQAELDVCYRCKKKIENISEFSIEHITPWLHSENPKKLFFSIENIAFSHLSCNVKSARKKLGECGTINKYRRGCRCSECKRAKSDRWQKYVLSGKRKIRA